MDKFSPTTPEKIELTIVMPCLNEAETLEICIQKAKSFLEEDGVTGEVIVADNGSTDGSQAIASRMGVRSIPVKNRGYGSALMGGIEASRGRYIIMGDADDSYDFATLGAFLEKLREGYDLVMGNRFSGEIMTGAMPPLHKYLGNPLLSFIGRLLFRSPCGDFNCGLRGFSKDSIMKMDLRTTGMEFASEIVVKASLQKMRITEVPITLFPDGRSRPPHLRSWRDGWRQLRFLLLYSPRWLFLYPGISLMSIGLMAMLWLLPGSRTIGNVTFDIHTLLYSAIFVITGFQAVVFSVFTKIFASSEGLLPRDKRLDRLFRFNIPEIGLIIGCLLIVAGSVGSLYAFGLWGMESFGPLDPTKILRIIIPASLALALGFQTVLSSFFLGVLQLGRRARVH